MQSITESHGNFLLAFRPPRIAQAMVVIATAVHFVVPEQWQPIFGNIWLGGVLATAGFAIMMLAWGLFRQGGVAICPTEPTSLLIENGIYRFTRNPMYLGIVMMMLGLAVAVGTLPFYIATLAYFLVIEFVFCPFEEVKLESTFGDAFSKYRRRVRRWI